jgi:lipoate-protein ligase A
MSIFDALEVYQDNIPRSAAMNMAIDEAILKTATVATLRSYRWDHPALSFGYFGSYADVADKRHERDVVRRWTGGGIVLHGDDLTYSVIIPATNPFFSHSSFAIYSSLHEAIQAALKASGIEATLAGSVSPKVSENCFANSVRADVIEAGRKIAGAAHRRSRAGLLHQGSIQVPELPRRFIDDFARTVCERFEHQTLSLELLARATDIAQAKYGTAEWLMRR